MQVDIEFEWILYVCVCIQCSVIGMEMLHALWQSGVVYTIEIMETYAAGLI